jgi:acetoin utilization deacetylase AcuC-like enzyme
MPLKHGSGDKEYFSAYNEVLPHLVKKFEPDIIIVSAGYDIRAEDPLSGIRVSDEGIRSIVNGILSCSSRPVIFALEGGYDLQALGKSVLLTIKEMLA